MKFVCANADLIQNINLDTDYDYITASSKSIIMAVETLANSFAKSKSDCVLFVWNTSDPADLVRATEEACVEDVNFKKIIDDLEKNLDYSVLGDFDLESIELENGMTISVVKYVTMNNLRESRKSIKESENFVNYIAVYDEDSNCRGYIQNESPRLTQDVEKALHFKNENEANTFRAKLIKRGSFNGDELYIEGMYLNESKESVRKSIKESVKFSKEKDIYIAQIKDSSISFAYTPIDTGDDFNGYFVFDGDDVIEYLNWKGADVNDMLKAFNDFEKAVKKYTSKEDAKIIIKDFHDKLGI